jgi:uncharacterized membrane protein YeaQ/YmgE (transglycosylase-associated protein family)
MDHLLMAILVGLVAGFLASHAVSGHGYGLLGTSWSESWERW